MSSFVVYPAQPVIGGHEFVVTINPQAQVLVIVIHISSSGEVFLLSPDYRLLYYPQEVPGWVSVLHCDHEL